MDQLICYWRTCLLAAAAGLFTSTTCLLLLLIDEDSSQVGKTQLSRLVVNGLSDCLSVVRSPSWPIKVSIAHIAFYVLASLILHRFLSAKRRSVFILWQYIGSMVVGAWGLITTIKALSGVLFDALPFHLISPFSPAGFKFTVVALAANVIYATAMQVAAKRYEHVT